MTETQTPPMPEAFFDAYVVAALWSETDQSDETGGLPLDDNYGREDIADEALAEMRDDCEHFWRDNYNDL